MGEGIQQQWWMLQGAYCGAIGGQVLLQQQMRPQDCRNACRQFGVVVLVFENRILVKLVFLCA